VSGDARVKRSSHVSRASRTSLPSSFSSAHHASLLADASTSHVKTRQLPDWVGDERLEEWYQGAGRAGLRVKAFRLSGFQDFGTSGSRVHGFRV
jgi:hypothetical protein